MSSARREHIRSLEQSLREMELMPGRKRDYSSKLANLIKIVYSVAPALISLETTDYKSDALKALQILSDIKLRIIPDLEKEVRAHRDEIKNRLAQKRAVRPQEKLEAQKLRYVKGIKKEKPKDMFDV